MENIITIRNGARIADIGGAACVEAIGVGVRSTSRLPLRAREQHSREVIFAVLKNQMVTTETRRHRGKQNNFNALNTQFNKLNNPARVMIFSLCLCVSVVICRFVG